MKGNNKTLAWKLYEDGRRYNNSLTPSQYSVVDTNTEFFAGNQWLHLPETPAMRGLPKPTFNIIKRIASLFIASLTSSAVTIHMEPLAYYDGGEVDGVSAADYANAEVANLLEKLKFDYRVRDALYDGAQTGDYCAHFWFDPLARPYGGAFGSHRGEICMELLDGINVMFGNPNDRRVDHQPYILLVGRDTVDHLSAEAEQYAGEKKEIRTDGENALFTGMGGKTEIHSDEGNGKALYVILYTMKEKEVDEIDPRTGQPVWETVVNEKGDPVWEKGRNGKILTDREGLPVPKRRKAKRLERTVHVTKATRDAVIYEDIDTGLSRYPIAWGNWEKQKNQYHGRALVTGIVPNQIFINSMFATAMRHLQLMAFPKTVYNADLISSWSNEVGQAIGVRGLQPGQSIGGVAYHLQPAEMSNQIFAMIDKALACTKECLGATDAQMGNVRPDNTSALMVLQTNAEVPLENIRSGLYEWVEDVGAILLDMMGTYYGKRPVVVDRQFEEIVMGADGLPVVDGNTGMMMTQSITRKAVDEFDFSMLKHLWLNLRVDVGATTQFSEIAMTQTLDNLRRDGTLNVIQYLERIPDKLIPKKGELLSELKKQLAQGERGNENAPAPVKGGYVQGGGLSTDKTIQTLPTAIQSRFDSLPGHAQRALVRQAEMKQS
ncbi:MAG: hypothetical protein PUB51_00600 [Oscillospiraceae bacterium]|nr:hypothetical protein [Oscillospiraceae bacterium]